MTDLVIRGGEASLSGCIEAPPSKAYTHRAIIASALSDGCSTVRNVLICDDTLATINACRMLGAEIVELSDGAFRIFGSPKPETPNNVIDCGGSGSTIRFLTPVCALADGISVLTGNESLRRRPMGPLLDALNQIGVKCYSTRMNGCPPIIVFGGGIKGGKANIRGDVSSQFISGLLFATPMAEKDTEIVLTTSLESKPYVEMTLNILEKHGIAARTDFHVFHVPSGQRYRPHDHFIEGDYSSAAFPLSAAAITGSNIKVKNLLKETLQGDRFIIDILNDAGVYVNVGEDFIETGGSSQRLKPLNVDMRDNPDLVPVCVVLAAFADGKSVIRGIRRLRFKESNRVEALLSEFSKMGVKINVLDDVMEVYGGGRIHGAEIDPHGDHRIAMACAIAALKASGETVIHDAECINKSYPNFVRDMRILGADIIER
ncbi:3-phosphoshikimate 1-carboxyvinyltransferase [Candidatus Bathyarchaeota archaeon]|nr:3-phosphoshikimate 1-carboxyvinyltransferase [Candidatus Bathyarchaeota archaeon]